MEGQVIFYYSHKRNSKVMPLASAKAVKITEDRLIDPALLFQRFLVVSQTGELSLDEVMKYVDRRKTTTLNEKYCQYYRGNEIRGKEGGFPFQ